MKKMTLGWRLGACFSALILLTCVLGGISVWRMNLASTGATSVSAVQVPEHEHGDGMCGSAWEARLNARGYAMTGREDYLRLTRKPLVALQWHLKEAGKMAGEHAELEPLRNDIKVCETKAGEFEEVVNSTEAEYKNLDAQLLAMNAAANIYAPLCLALRDAQAKLLDAEVNAQEEPAKVTQRLEKVRLIEDLIDYGNIIRLNNFKAQSTGDMDLMRETLNNFDGLAKAATSLGQMLGIESQVQDVKKIQEAADQYKVAVEQVLKARLAVAELMQKLTDSGRVVTDSATSVTTNGLLSIGNAATDVSDGLSLTSAMVTGGLLVALFVGVLIAWLSTRAITAPIREGINALAATASEISTTISQLASNSSETAAAVAEITTTVDEVRQTAQVAADKAKSVADSAQGSMLAAETGRKATDQSVQGLNLIRDQMSSIGESITRLNLQSQAVGDIVSTVADLAEQSNLLAVNASIEAAKAGDQGKGFGVVAQEIRNLAEQSKDSTKQVRAILTDVQKATSNAVVAAEQGSRGVADGSKQADQAGQAIRTLASTIQDATRAAIQIAATSQQQLAGIEQVGRAMGNIRAATSQNAQGAHQLAAAAHNLRDIGARLKALVDADGNRALVADGKCGRPSVTDRR